MDLSNIVGFDWDDANRNKNWQKHKVDFKECEDIFFNHPLFVYSDERHSKSETRYIALGTTNAGKKICLSFTFRRDQIRVISARPQSRKERQSYEKQTP